jgi:Protein of unknown function (DUF3017)
MVVVRWEVPPSRRIAFLVVLAVVAGSVVVATLPGLDARAGGYTLAGALALAAVMRAVLPEKYCLGLLVRSRHVDVVMAAALAMILFTLTKILPT